MYVFLYIDRAGESLKIHVETQRAIILSLSIENLKNQTKKILHEMHTIFLFVPFHSTAGLYVHMYYIWYIICLFNSDNFLVEGVRPLTEDQALAALEDR